MRFEQLQTVSIVRPGVGRRYSMLPVDRVDVTGFRASYAGSPLKPTMLDIREGDQVFWYDNDVRKQAFIDEVVIEDEVLRVAFRDAMFAGSEW